MPSAQRVARITLDVLVASFFHRVEVAGRENVPAEGGGVLVSWHPNGLIDPGLILTKCPRPVIFGARHGLFRWPGLGALMRSLGTVPIYRAADVGADDAEAARRANRQSLAALAEGVAGGALAALFPEGQSHDAPHPTALKTGAARLYYQAREGTPAGRPPPVLLPVALHYDRKDSFRSKALVVFHPAIPIPAELDETPAPDEPEERAQERCRALTEEISRVLHEVVHATRDWQLHQDLHRARSIVQAERAALAGEAVSAELSEQTRIFRAIRDGYYERVKTHPKQVARLRRRIRGYDRDLRALKLDDADLDDDPPLTSPWLVPILVLQLFAFVLLVPPILLVGYAVNLPAGLALRHVARRAAALDKDTASIKILTGAIVMPLTWIGVGALAAWGHHHLHLAYPGVPDTPILAGALAATLAAMGAVVGLRFRRVARQMARSIAVRATRRRERATIERLRGERAWIHSALLELA